MIANGFKPVAWVGAVGAAALGCYMLSLRVAAERADVASLERRIVATQQQIRALQTELGTRGRLQQLEQWNEQVLALSAPVSGQYLQSNVQLARFSTTQPQPLDQAAEVRMASAETASATPAVPAARLAVADSAAAAPPPPVAQPMVQRASLTLPQPAPATAQATAPRRPAAAASPPPRARAPATASASREASPRQAAPRTAERAPIRVASNEPRPAAQRTQAAAPRTQTATPARSQAAASRGRGSSLLDERTVRELGTAARAEGRGGTRD